MRGGRSGSRVYTTYLVFFKELPLVEVKIGGLGTVGLGVIPYHSDGVAFFKF
jgi:hypothetical protein